MSNSFIIIEDNLHRGISLSDQIRTTAMENSDINIKDVIILFYCDGNNADLQIKEMKSIYDFSKYNIRVVDIFSFEQIVSEYMEKDNNMIMICDYYLENDYSEGIPARKPGIQYARKNRNYLQDDRIWIYTGQGSNTVKIIDELTGDHSIKMLSCNDRELTLNLLENPRFVNRLMKNDDCESENICVCAYCGKLIDAEKDGYVRCMDNFLQQKYFDDTDGKDNIFCSLECACEHMGIKHIYPTVDKDMGF